MNERRHDGRAAALLEELDALLDGIGHKVADSSDPFRSSAPSAPTGSLYTAFTAPWGKLVGGLVLTATVVADVTLDLTDGLSLESYLVAWAAVSTSIWFVFDKTEAAVSTAVRKKTARWLVSGGLQDSLRGLPSSFTVAFDRIFGERHLTWTCFYRSCFASLLTVLIAMAIWISADPTAYELLLHRDSVINLGRLMLLAGVFNFIPDYLSLLESRWAIRMMERTGRIGTFLALDAVLTALISAGLIYLSVLYVYGTFIDVGAFLPAAWDLITVDGYFGDVGLFLTWAGGGSAGEVALPMGLFFYSAFMTSVWLWIYVLISLVARLLLKTSGGVGALLKATDVERHPFRSLGYVSVLIIAVGFAVGLPFIVL